MHTSVIISRGSELAAHAYPDHAYPEYGSVILSVTSDRGSASISFTCAADVKRAALALLDAASQLRAPAPQGLVVEDVV